MTTDEFWKIIEAIQPESIDMKRKCAALSARLATLSPDEVHSFADHYWHCRRTAYHWPLWDAASLMHGGCGDDKFMDFRSALITFGRDAFERALADPDTLAEWPDPLPDGGDVYGAIYSVVDGVLGGQSRPSKGELSQPTGTSIEDANEDYETAAREHFPRLAARYLSKQPKVDSPARPWWKFW